MMKKNRHDVLAVIDWGIGGCSVVRALRSRLGEIPLLYFSDTGVTPYGKMSKSQLASRLNAVVRFLDTQGVTHLVVGCNAASSVIPLVQSGEMQVVGVINSAVRLIRRLRPTNLALIGGRRTVLSGVYRNALAAYGIDVRQRIAQPLSAMIENGDVGSAELLVQCKKILSPVRACSHLLLACTHYPAITPALTQFLSEKSIVIDPAEELASKVAKWKISTGGSDRFYTTGDPEQMKHSAYTAFGVRIKAAKRVVIQ